MNFILFLLIFTVVMGIIDHRVRRNRTDKCTGGTR